MKYILSILCLCLVGCGSTRGPSVTESVKADKAYQVVNDAVPYIQGISQAAIKLALQYAEKDPEKKIELQLQVHTVSVNLERLLERGDFSPGAVTDALKVKEKYIEDILSAVSIAYTAFYAKLEENDSVELAIRVLKAVAKGVAAGTE